MESHKVFFFRGSANQLIGIDYPTIYKADQTWCSPTIAKKLHYEKMTVVISPL